MAPSPDEIAAQLLSLADGQHEIPRVVAQLLHRGWLRTDAGDRLYLTDAGEAARIRLRELVTELRAVVHDGISDEEYVATLKVLRRMISNVEDAGKLSEPRCGTMTRLSWIGSARFGEVKGYDRDRIPAPDLPPVPLKPRGRVR